MAAGPWDLIIADIPWRYDQQSVQITRPKDQRRPTKMRHLVTYPTVDYVEMFQAFAAALHPHRNVWCWSDWYSLPELFAAAQAAGLTYRGLCAVKRRGLWLGMFLRKDLYYVPVWSKGKPYYNKAVAASFPEYLGEYRIKRSAKPQAVYDRIIAHSLPPGGTWIDPFPATHIEEYPGPAGSTLLAPSLWS